MSNRDLITEILEKKQRIIGGLYEASFRLSDLESSFSRLEKQTFNDSILLSLYVVGITACVELAVRNAICRLVDAGHPYLDRITDLLKKQNRFDFDIAKALHEKKFTFGDFVSHLLPISRLDQIMSHLDTLFGCQAREALANVREFVEPPDSLLFGTKDEKLAEKTDEAESEKEVSPPQIVPDIDSLMADIGRLFKTRHVTAHEADFQLVSEDDIRVFFSAGRMFIDTLGEYIEQKLNPNASRNAFGMSIIAATEAGKTYESMERTYHQLIQLIQSLPEDRNTQAIEMLEASQQAFNKYLAAEEEFQEALVSPISGNGLRMLNAYTQMALCKDREERLKDIIKESFI
jgi:hypothetical protein